jgi:hypothetical protein
MSLCGQHVAQQTDAADEARLEWSFAADLGVGQTSLGPAMVIAVLLLAGTVSTATGCAKRATLVDQCREIHGRL